MKKFTTLALAGLVATSVFGQQPGRPKHFASPEQIAATSQNVKNTMLFHEKESKSIVQSTNLPEAMTPSPSGKIAAVSPVLLGTASNVFTILRQEQNQVFADDAMDLVGFIHRNNAGLYGGNSGHMRYDISIDGGVTFTNDIGNLNPTLTLPGRYPNATYYNPAGNTNPLAAGFVTYAPTLGTPTWDGHFNSYSIITNTTITPAPTEHYDFQGQGTLLPGGLCEGLPGEFWATDLDFDGTNAVGDITIFKGIYGSNDIIWSVQSPLSPNHDISIDGTATIIGSNMAFSPDRSVGWIAWLGDLVGGVDSVLSPCFSKTTDNGVTWSTPAELNMSTITWLADSLTAHWTDSLTGLPAGSGIATCAFDFDLTVDKNGNPHLAVVVGNYGSGQAYSIGSSLEKYLVDFYSNDGGATWDAHYVSPVLTFRTAPFGGATTVTMDNNVQISRNEAGDHIFYAWSDSDTAQVTGNGNGIGFGIFANSSPNLRVAGVSLIDWTQTYPQLVTDLDLLWDGRALFPTMAPTVLTDANGCFKLPIVMAAMDNDDPAITATFHYFGNDASICAADFCDPEQMNFSWEAYGFNTATPVCAVGLKDNVQSGVVLGNAYPNPTANNAVIGFELPTAGAITIDMVNAFGQQVAVLANGEFNAGAHRVVVNTEKLAAGVYFYSLRTNEQVISKRLVVTK